MKTQKERYHRSISALLKHSALVKIQGNSTLAAKSEGQEPDGRTRETRTYGGSKTTGGPEPTGDQSTGRDGNFPPPGLAGSVPAAPVTQGRGADTDGPGPVGPAGGGGPSTEPPQPNSAPGPRQGPAGSERVRTRGSWRGELGGSSAGSGGRRGRAGPPARRAGGQRGLLPRGHGGGGRPLTPHPEAERPPPGTGSASAGTVR